MSAEEEAALIEDQNQNENILLHRSLFASLPTRTIFYSMCTVLYITIYLVYFLISKDSEEFNFMEFFSMSSDLVIALSYFVIPFLLIYVVTLRKDVPFNYLFWMFSLFIVGCGSTHLLGMGYFAKMPSLSTIAKIFTSFISFATAAVLTQNIPIALSLPSPEQLKREIQQRVLAQKKLQSQYQKVVLLREITHHLRQSVRPADILQTAVTQLGKALKASRCTVHFDLENLSKSQYEYLGENITSVAFLKPVRVSDSKILSEQAAEQIRTRLVSYAETDGDSLQQVFEAWNVASLICVNLSFLHQTNKNGWIFIQHEYSHLWSREEIELVEGTTAQITSCLTQAHLIELDKAREVAEKASEAKTQFLAMVSHEVRTPMNAIFGMINVLQHSHLEETEKECVRIISDSSSSLLNLLNSILDFAKIESGKLEVENRSFQIRKCLNRVFMLGKNMIATKTELQLIQQPIPDEIPEFIVSDKYRLEQILVNLLSNASKFTVRGEITVGVKVKEVLEDKSVKLQFEVRDTGIGIPENRLHVLFKAFSQVDASMTRKYGGSGLGLVISKRLCEAMNGEMWVKSEIGKGTTFFFTITAQVASTADADSEEEQDTQELSSTETLSTKILIAEDNAVNQMVAKRMLNQMGFSNLTIVGDGQQAYDSVMKEYKEKKPFDIVLMDLHMPTVDGITSTMRIRGSIDSRIEPYIIALTADIQEPIKNLCKEIGMNNFVGKPFKVKELKEALVTGVATLKQSRKKKTRTNMQNFFVQ